MTDSITALLTQLDENHDAIRQYVADSELNGSSQPDDDYTALLDLTRQRDKLVQKLLQIIPDDQRQQFVQAQVVKHQQLQQETDKLFEQIEQQLAGFMRSKKAVRSYK